MSQMERRYEIGEVARQLDRVPHTLRVWQSTGRLPKHLLPQRDSRNRRYWYKSQIEGLKQWMIDADMSPGKAFRRKEQT